MSDETPTDEPVEGSAPKPLLNFAEARVLGCLLEKEATTPDHYPLSPNSLHTACNQSSNREPVTDLGTDEVEEAMEGLRYKKLAILVHQSGARVPKCRHTLENKLPYITKGQQALLCVLLLRGQQTAGELRQRTERMHPFVDVEKVESTLELMTENNPVPLVKIIPAGGGRRVVTYLHTLCGEVSQSVSEAVTKSGEVTPVSSWRTEMEEQIESLKSEVLSLRTELEELKSNLGV